MTEGTKSYLFGSHHWLLHPVAIIRAWRAHYGHYPCLWQAVCIFLHDTGIVGMQYLSGTKDGHWRRGAEIAGWLFGLKGWKLCAGHCIASGWPRSALLFPDKASWIYQPKWRLALYHLVEGFNDTYTVEEWLASVRERARDGFQEDGHAVFMREREKKAAQKGGGNG